MLVVVFKYNPVQKYGCGRLQKKIAGILNAELNFWMACKQPPKKKRCCCIRPSAAAVEVKIQ